MIYPTSLVFCIINEIERITVIGNKDGGMNIYPTEQFHNSGYLF